MAAGVNFYRYSLTFVGEDAVASATSPGTKAYRFTNSNPSILLTALDAVKLIVLGGNAVIKVLGIQRQPTNNVNYTIFVDADDAVNMQPFSQLQQNQLVTLTFVSVEMPFYSFDVIPCSIEKDVKTVQVLAPAGRVMAKLFYGFAVDTPAMSVPGGEGSAPVVTAAPIAQVVTTTPANKTFIKFGTQISGRVNTTSTVVLFFHSNNYNTDLNITSYQNGLYDDVQALLKKRIIGLVGALDANALEAKAESLVVDHIIDDPTNRMRILGNNFPDDRVALPLAILWIIRFVMKMIYELNKPVLKVDAVQLFESALADGSTKFESDTVAFFNRITNQLASVTTDYRYFAENTTLSQDAVMRAQSQRDVYQNKMDYIDSRTKDTLNLIKKEQGKIIMFGVFLGFIIATIVIVETFYRSIISTTTAASILLGFGSAVLSIGIVIVVVGMRRRM